MSSVIKIMNKSLLFIFITVLLDVIGLGIIIPVTPDLIKELTGENISEAAKYSGWLMFSYAIMQFICSPLLGSLSDKYGRRPVLLLSLLTLGLDYFFQALSPNIVWLFVGRVVAGIGGASFSTATAYIADISEPEKRSQNFGLIGAAFGIGFIIGPLIGGIVGEYWGTRASFIIAGILCILNFAYGYFILPESLSEANRRDFSLKEFNPFATLINLQKFTPILGLILGEFMLFIANKAVESNWNFFTEYKFGWDKQTIGISLAVVGVAVAIVQGYLIRKIIPKIGEKKSIYVGIVFETLGLFLFGLAHKDWMMFAILIPFALGGIGGAAMQGVMSNQVNNDKLGELQGTINGMHSLTYIIGPLMMNQIFYYFTNKNAPIILPGAPFFVGTAFALVGLWFCHKNLSKLKSVF
ncbi:MAG: TCR/Tet family MFS transporter [Cytophagales bacterium]